MTTEEEIRDLVQRKDGAIERLVNTYTGPLLAGALAIGFTKTDAEDLVQETFVAFLGAMDRFEGRSKLKTYLFGILYNKAKEMRKKQRREVNLDEVQEDFENRFDARGGWSTPPQGPEESVLSQEIRDMIEECAKNLSPTQSAAFFLTEVSGESPEEICNTLGIRATHLRVLLHRARMNLRECLEKHWGRRK